MDRPHVTIRYRRDVPHPIEPAFAWLTDYQDDDPALTTALVRERRVVARKSDEVHFEGALHTLGRLMPGTGSVKLYPEEHRWVATLGRHWMVNEYRLTSTAAGCRLDVEYRIYPRKWTRRLAVWLAKPRLKREIGTMWDGFFAQMDKDLGR
ncbi:MAG: hypothetical protein QOE90_290 [Thermoplasmata archaeon]|jgi:hypothetical protein|nr:hypothetical protein [Thermoplasmata archaeon]